LPPVPKEPEVGRCLFLCDDCRDQAENPKRFRAGERWRFLTQSLWSELPAVQVLAVRLLRRQADSQDWARESLEDAWLDPVIEEWAAQEK
jgi:protein PhnA